MSGTNEEPGFGLYSYLLFGARPDDQTRLKYLAIVRELVANAERTDLLIRSGAKRDQLNVFHIPVTRYPTRSASPDETAKWVVDHYDFARAKVLMSRAGLDVSGGPYMVSSTEPLSTSQSVAVVLQQDFSIAGDETVRLWTREFIHFSSTPAEWNRNSLRRVALHMRTFLETVAVAGEPVIKAAENVIKVVEVHLKG